MQNRRRLFVVLLLGALPGTFASAQQGDGESVFAAARSAVAKGQVERSQQVGFSNTKTAFTDNPFNGGVLVGFEIGLGKAGNDEVVHCLRALYSTPDGVTPSPEFGQFFDKTLPSGKVRKTKVTRTVRVEADPGYAVAGVTLRTRIGISGIKVTFQRLNGQTLDPKQSYSSDWVGDAKGGGQSIMTKGSPAIGVFGNIDEPQILALGLIWFKQAELAKAPAAAFKPPAEPQPRKRQEPEKQPTAQAEQPKASAEPAKQTADAAKPQIELPAAPPAAKPMLKPRPELQPPAEPEPQPAEPDPQAEENVRPAAPVVRAPAEIHEQGAGDDAGRIVSLMLLPVVLLVALVGFALLAANQRRTTSFAYRQLPPSVIPVVKPASPPPLPSPPLATTDPSTAIAAQPLLLPPPLPHQHTAPWAERWHGPAPAVEQPPFFTVRLVNGFSKRFCRAFLLPKEMLLLNAGMENPDQTAVAFVALGGLVGGLIGHFIAKSQRKTVEDRQRVLDDAGTRDLVRLASRERDALWVPMADVESAAIEPISFWRSLASSNCVALLHLEHRECGPITLELPTPIEARMAMEYLTTHLGERLVSRVAWDKKKQRLVEAKSEIRNSKSETNPNKAKEEMTKT
jgi:hypothetical protein